MFLKSGIICIILRLLRCDKLQRCIPAADIVLKGLTALRLIRCILDTSRRRECELWNPHSELISLTDLRDYNQ